MRALEGVGKSMGSVVEKLCVYQPLSDVFELLKDNEQIIFLDSSEKSDQGRFSIVGHMPFLTIEQVDDVCLVNGVPQSEPFFDVLDAYLRKYAEPNRTHLPLTGGALGYLGYDFGRKLNGVSTRHAADENDLSLPDAQMIFYDILLIEDNKQQALYVCSQGKTALSKNAKKWADNLIASCQRAPLPVQSISLEPFTSRFSEQEYHQALGCMAEYMLDGHIYVANMTQQLTMKAPVFPYEVYRYLRTFNPAPFSAYMQGQNFRVCCSSMERFLLVRDKHVVTRPIKGTRARGKTMQEDERNKQELLSSKKDNSELLMIVDLERNDLSRTCKPGTIFTHSPFAVETYPTVFHLVATIEGQLEEQASALDVVRNAFPGGSITGAPKIRAMEIIDELERSARGLYTGSIGYFSNAGDCDFNVVIRTIVCNNKVAHLGVGGGITAESDFAFEYQETLQKAQALRQALAAVNASSLV